MPFYWRTRASQDRWDSEHDRTRAEWANPLEEALACAFGLGSARAGGGGVFANPDHVAAESRSSHRGARTARHADSAGDAGVVECDAAARQLPGRAAIA